MSMAIGLLSWCVQRHKVTIGKMCGIHPACCVSCCSEGLEQVRRTYVDCGHMSSSLSTCPQSKLCQTFVDNVQHNSLL